MRFSFPELFGLPPSAKDRARARGARARAPEPQPASRPRNVRGRPRKSADKPRSRPGVLAFAHLLGLAAKPIRARRRREPMTASFLHLGGVEPGTDATAVPLTSPEPTDADLAAAERSGRLAERRRLSALMLSPEGRHDPSLALHMACEHPRLSALAVRGLIASVRGPPPAPPTAAERRARERQARREAFYSGTARAQGPDADSPEAFGQAAAAARTKAEALGVSARTQPTGGATFNVGSSGAPRSP